MGLRTVAGVPEMPQIQNVAVLGMGIGNIRPAVHNRTNFNVIVVPCKYFSN